MGTSTAGTRSRARSKAEGESPGLKVELDGKIYIVRQSDLTPHDVRALRQETGLSWIGLGRALATDPDIDLVAALVWLKRRVDGDQVSYDEVLGSMSYDSDLNISLEDKRQRPATASADDPDADPPA
jgi:hypothetical protein